MEILYFSQCLVLKLNHFWLMFQFYTPSGYKIEVLAGNGFKKKLTSGFRRSHIGVVAEK